MKTSIKKAALRSATFLTLCAAVSATQAFAQSELPSEVAEAEAAETGEAIVVTGSRIARPTFDSSTPILSLGADALDNRGFENIADLATQLPQFAASFGSSRTQSTFSGAATSGLNTLNLRNLGGGRTLTLINGRRVPGGTTTGTAVDFNMIPTANIERLEVITGGASAVYGADAVAGVVNVITKRNFEGFEAGASYGISERGDNRNPSAYLMYGAKFGDGGRVLLTGQYDFQGRVRCSSRFICAEDFFWTPPSAPNRGPAAYSAVGANATFFLLDNPNTAATDPLSVTRVGDSTSYTDAQGNLIPFVVTRDGYNRNGIRDIAIPTRRLLAAAEAEYPLTDGLKVFAEFNYGQSRTNGAFEGHPFQSTAAGSLFGGGPGVTGLQANIPVNIQSTTGGVTTSVKNPIIPQAVYDSAVARGQTSIAWQQRFNAIDERGAKNEREMIRAVAGLRGDFEIGLGKNWQYELSYTYGQTKLDSLTRGLVSTRNLYYGVNTQLVNGTLQCADAAARAAGCIPINPFQAYTTEQQNALAVAAGQSGKTVLHDALAYVSGSLFTLPGGDLSVALGAEYRTLSGFLDYDAVINNAEVTGNQIGDVSFIKTKTKEFFIEGIAPVLGGMDWLHSLTLEGAYRYSDPSRGGTYKTWRYGGTVEPIQGLKFRVMRSKAVRTPTPGELSGVSQTFGTVTDPCSGTARNTNAALNANCLADGVPAGYVAPQSVLQSVGGFVGGNPNLDPESSISLTYGVAFAPSFIPGLQITIDRFEIKLDDMINTVGRQLKANQCYNNATRLFCEDITRGTNPQVPGANYVLTGVNDQLINVASLRIKGIDFDARYAFDLANGRANVGFIATRYDKAELTPLPGQTPTKLLGFAGGSTSDQGFIKFTANANLGWQSNDGFGFNYNIRYIGKAQNSPFSAPAALVTIGDRFYHNARFNIRVEEDFQFYFGIDNIADSQPPFFPSSTAGTQALDTIPAYYDVFGRSFYAGFRANF